MEKNIIVELKKMEKKINEILERDGYTEEVESLQDKIVWFCLRNGIDFNTYATLISSPSMQIGGKLTMRKFTSKLWNAITAPFVLLDESRRAKTAAKRAAKALVNT